MNKELIIFNSISFYLLTLYFSISVTISRKLSSNYGKNILKWNFLILQAFKKKYKSLGVCYWITSRETFFVRTIWSWVYSKGIESIISYRHKIIFSLQLEYKATLFLQIFDCGTRYIFLFNYSDSTK